MVFFGDIALVFTRKNDVEKFSCYTRLYICKVPRLYQSGTDRALYTDILLSHFKKLRILSKTSGSLILSEDTSIRSVMSMFECQLSNNSGQVAGIKRTIQVTIQLAIAAALNSNLIGNEVVWS